MLPPKGKGKGNWEQPKGGKGGWSPWGFQGNCYNCGGKGHSARFCPHPKGKGKGKGLNSLEGGESKEVTLGGDAAQLGPQGAQQGAREPEAETTSDAIKPQMQMGTHDTGYPLASYEPPWNPWTDVWGTYMLEEVRVNTLEEAQDKAKSQATLNAVEPETKSGNAPLSKEKRAEIRERLAERFSKTHDRYKVCPDSGSWKMVANEEFAPGVEVKESEGSKNGVYYKCANKTLVKNKGEKHVSGNDINGNVLKSKWQIADISKNLAGVIEMVRAGNRVVFDREQGENVSSILNKETGVLIPIGEVNDSYEFDMFVQKTPAVNVVEEKVKEEIAAAPYRGYWETLDEDETIDMSGFFTGLV